MTSDVVKFLSILALGGSLGMFAAAYPPLFAVAGTGLFTLLSIALYLSSVSRNPFESETITTSLMAEPMEKSGLLGWLFYAAFFLSITIPKSGRTIASVPITAANMGILLALLWWVLIQVISRKSISRLPEFVPLLFFIFYGGSAVLIGLMNRNPLKVIALDFSAFIGFIPVFFLACSVIRTKAHIQRLISIIIFSLVLVCIYGILQTRMGFERIAIHGITEQYGKITYQGVGRWNVIEGGGTKVYSTFQNGNVFGNHLATFIPVIGGLLIGAPTSRKKLLFSGVFILCGYVLILSYSRGAMVGTLCGIFFLAVISKKIRLKAVIVFILLGAVLAAFFMKYSDRPELVRYDFRRMAENPDQFSAGRLERAEKVIEGVALLPMSSKLFGLGLGGMLHKPWFFVYADNLYLTFLFKFGVVGLIVVFGVLGHLFFTLLRLRRNTDDLYLKALMNGGIAGLFASLVHNLADTLWYFPPISANFWFLAGITMAIGVIGTRKPLPETVEENIPLKKPVLVKRHAPAYL